MISSNNRNVSASIPMAPKMSKSNLNNQLFAIIDFETTGLYPQRGDRITEVAVVLIRNNQIVDRFDSLVNTGCTIPDSVQQLTGINNAMISTAPLVSQIIPKLNKFIKDATLVAHNAAFDSKFLESELTRFGLSYEKQFVCTLLLSRRLYQMAPDKKLQTLAEYHNINRSGNAHRALSDALVTADLFIKIYKDLLSHCAVSELNVPQLISLQRKPLKDFSSTSLRLHEEKIRNGTLKVKPPSPPTKSTLPVSPVNSTMKRSNANNSGNREHNSWTIIIIVVVVFAFLIFSK